MIVHKWLCLWSGRHRLFASRDDKLLTTTVSPLILGILQENIFVSDTQCLRSASFNGGRAFGHCYRKISKIGFISLTKKQSYASNVTAPCLKMCNGSNTDRLTGESSSMKLSVSVESCRGRLTNVVKIPEI